jgi:hypothetical protein
MTGRWNITDRVVVEIREHEPGLAANSSAFGDPLLQPASILLRILVDDERVALEFLRADLADELVEALDERFENELAGENESR